MKLDVECTCCQTFLFLWLPIIYTRDIGPSGSALRGHRVHPFNPQCVERMVQVRNGPFSELWVFIVLWLGPTAGDDHEPGSLFKYSAWSSVNFWLKNFITSMLWTLPISKMTITVFTVLHAYVTGLINTHASYRSSVSLLRRLPYRKSVVVFGTGSKTLAPSSLQFRELSWSTYERVALTTCALLAEFCSTVSSKRLSRPHGQKRCHVEWLFSVRWPYYYKKKVELFITKMYFWSMAANRYDSFGTTLPKLKTLPYFIEDFSD